MSGRLQVWTEFARPFTLLVPAVGFLTGGLTALGPDPPPGGPWQAPVLVPILLGTLMAAALNVASNGINQIYDLEIDAVNKPGRPLPSGRMSLREAWAVTIAFYAISLLLAWFSSPPGAHGLAGRETFWIVCAGALLTWAYSAPPLRTKRHWLWANVTIAVPRGLLLKVAGWASAATVLDLEPWLLGGVFFLFLLGAASTKDFADMAGDLARGCRTLPIRFGVERAARMIAPFLVVPFLLLPAGAAAGLLRGNPVGLTVLGVLLTLYGSWIAFLILRRPEALATESNHVSWKHMYLLMLAAHLGILAAYWN